MKKLVAVFSVVLIAVLVLILVTNHGPKRMRANPVVIVPHFDVFKNQRREFLANLSKQTNPQKIVLFSVNHFSQGKADLITTNRHWDFKDTKIKVDEEGYKQLIRNDKTDGEENPFISEHGIKNVLPDLGEFFPKAEIIPVMVREDIGKEELDQIFEDLFASLGDYMPVFSIDFSHYSPNSMAQIHDAYSLSSLENLDENKAYLAETDSPQLMNMAVKWAKRTGNEHFNSYFNSNSGEQNKNDEVETTSVVIGYFANGTKNESKKSTLAFCGDIMLDRLVYHTYKNEGIKQVFAKIGPRFFKGVDLSMANLEGPISKTQIADDTNPGNPTFNFPSDTPEALKYLNINTVSLANNHTLNAGESGLENTASVLKNVGIAPLGRPDNTSDAMLERIESKIPLSVIAVNELSAKDDISDLVKSEKKLGRFVIIYSHWGIEYSNTHNQAQVELASAWQKAGADMIIGSHPHVIEDLGVINDMPVLYSLGNFVFDQNFSKETEEGLAVGGIIDEHSIKLSFFPIKIINQAPELIRGPRRKEVLESLLGGASGYQRINSDTILLNKL